MKNIRKYVDMFKVRASWVASVMIYRRFLSHLRPVISMVVRPTVVVMPLMIHLYYISPYPVSETLTCIGRHQRSATWVSTWGFRGGTAYRFAGCRLARSVPTVLLTDRSIPSYYGMNYTVANVGSVDAKGYEFEPEGEQGMEQESAYMGKLQYDPCYQRD